MNGWKDDVPTSSSEPRALVSRRCHFRASVKYGSVDYQSGHVSILNTYLEMGLVLAFVYDFPPFLGDIP